MSKAHDRPTNEVDLYPYIGGGDVSIQSFQRLDDLIPAQHGHALIMLLAARRRPASAAGFGSATQLSANEAWSLLHRDPTLPGTPIGLSACREGMEYNHRSAASGGTLVGLPGTGPVVVKQITSQQVPAVEEMFGRIGRIEFGVSRVGQMVRTEVQPFFSGRRTAEQTARSLQEKVTTYLRE